MLQFNGATAIPIGYQRLTALTHAEIEESRRRGYIELDVNPFARVKRKGIDIYQTDLPAEDVCVWQTRVFLVWFCYVYENFIILAEPLYAVEELVLEFRGPEILDKPQKRLATLYAGAGGEKTPLLEERLRELISLAEHYQTAVDLLTEWGKGGHPNS